MQEDHSDLRSLTMETQKVISAIVLGSFALALCSAKGKDDSRSWPIRSKTPLQKRNWIETCESRCEDAEDWRCFVDCADCFDKSDTGATLDDCLLEKVGNVKSKNWIENCESKCDSWRCFVHCADCYDESVDGTSLDDCLRLKLTDENQSANNQEVKDEKDDRWWIGK